MGNSAAMNNLGKLIFKKNSKKKKKIKLKKETFTKMEVLSLEIL